MRLYEQGTFDSLRERCVHVRSDAVRERVEVADITNGLIAEHEDSRRGQQRYSLFAYDKDKQVFTLIDGQRLGRDARLTLPLALPRDYAYCRIVRNSESQESLEVVHVARNEMANLDKARRQYDDLLVAAKPQARTVPANEGKVLCANPARSGVIRARTQLLGEGGALSLEACPDALLYMSERADRLLRSVFGR